MSSDSPEESVQKYDLIGVWANVSVRHGDRTQRHMGQSSLHSKKTRARGHFSSIRGYGTRPRAANTKTRYQLRLVESRSSDRSQKVCVGRLRGASSPRQHERVVAIKHGARQRRRAIAAEPAGYLSSLKSALHSPWSLVAHRWCLK